MNNVARTIAGIPLAIDTARLENLLARAEIAKAAESFGDVIRTKTAGSIGVLPLTGPIGYRTGPLAWFFGVTDLKSWSAEFDTLVRDPSVKSIIIPIDSPGGSVDGVQELSAKIYQARGRKPITAVADTLMASAAFWIGTAADKVVVTPSGEVGSVGVIAVHADYSKAAEQEGIAFTIVKAGKFKGEGNPYEPLDDEARSALQGRIDAVYRTFISDLARNRNVSTSTIESNFGQGRTFLARDAVRNGLADSVDTLDSVISAAGMSPARRASLLSLKTRRLRLSAGLPMRTSVSALRTKLAGEGAVIRRPAKKSQSNAAFAADLIRRMKRAPSRR